jgi:hypothetical protein
MGATMDTALPICPGAAPSRWRCEVIRGCSIAVAPRAMATA